MIAPVRGLTKYDGNIDYDSRQFNTGPGNGFCFLFLVCILTGCITFLDRGLDLAGGTPNRLLYEEAGRYYWVIF